MTTQTWFVFNAECKVVGEYATEAEATYWAKMYGAGYWVSSGN